MSKSRKNTVGVNVKLGPETKSPVKTVTQKDDDISDRNGPLCIAVVGDFSGRGNAQCYEPTTIHRRQAIEVNRDNLDQTLARFNVTLRLWLDDESTDPLEIPICSLEDFHPDRLYQNTDIFARLRTLRARLQDSRTFREAAREIQAWRGDEEEGTRGSANHLVKPDNKLTEAGLLDSMLEASQDSQSAGIDSGEALADELVKLIVSPYVEPKPDPQQDELLAAVDEAISANMRFILHHPDFQALESAWLGLEFLIRRTESDRRVRVFMLDIARQELEVDLSEDKISRTGLYKRFGDPPSGDLKWGLLVGNYRFTDRVQDIMTLLQIGAVARRAQAPFICAGNETLIGCESFAVTPDVEDWNYRPAPEVQEAWTLLRKSDEAEYLSMVAPGFLLRMPYGKQSRQIDSFAFEEIPEFHWHSCYLWGNGAFIKAEQIARAFIQEGWDMNPAMANQVDALPLHCFSQEGETEVKPCAEILLTERGARRILQQGLIPLWSVKNSDCIRSSDFHSLAF